MSASNLETKAGASWPTGKLPSLPRRVEGKCGGDQVFPTDQPASPPKAGTTAVSATMNAFQQASRQQVVSARVSTGAMAAAEERYTTAVTAAVAAAEAKRGGGIPKASRWATLRRGAAKAAGAVTARRWSLMAKSVPTKKEAAVRRWSYLVTKTMDNHGTNTKKFFDVARRMHDSKYKDDGRNRVKHALTTMFRKKDIVVEQDVVPLLSPPSRYRQWWDVLVICAVVYSSIVVPLDLAQVVDAKATMPGLQVSIQLSISVYVVGVVVCTARHVGHSGCVECV